MKERKLLCTITIGKQQQTNGDLNVPKSLQERFYKLEPDSSLDPEWGKYILYYNDGWGYPMGANEYWNSIPVRNKKEAIEFLRDAIKVDSEVLH